MFCVDKIITTYPDSAIQALIALLSYIGAPAAVSIGFYSWKAKNENSLKIQKSSNMENNEQNQEINEV
jgi:hypothetical protein